MTEFTGGKDGTFIEVAIPREENWHQWDAHYHFNRFVEVVDFFRRQDAEFFAHGEPLVVKCADEGEKIAIELAYDEAADKAYKRDHAEFTLSHAVRDRRESQKWIQFYNDVLAQAPYVLQMLESHKSTIAKCDGTIAELEAKIKDLTCG